VNPLFVITSHPANATSASKLRAQFIAIYGYAPFAFVDALGLKLPGTGGRWTHRYLEFALKRARGCTHIIKLDADVTLNRKCVIPEGADIFASIWRDGIAGAAIGFTVQAAQRLVNSKLLVDPRYKAPAWNYTDGQGVQRACNDKVMTDVCKRLTISIHGWPDVYCRRGAYVEGDYSAVSVTARLSVKV
jgi:hypothetical protein